MKTCLVLPLLSLIALFVAQLDAQTNPGAPLAIKAVRGQEFPRVFTKGVTDAGDWSQIEPLFAELEKEIVKIRTPEALQVWLERQSELNALLEEEGGRRYIAFTGQTDDPAAEAANAFFVETITPRLKPWTNKLAGLYLDNPARHGLEARRMKVHDRVLDNQRRLFRARSVPLQAADDKKVMEYDKLCGGMTVSWRGEERTLDQMEALQEEQDRAVREQAWRLVAARRLKDRDPINEIYAEMVRLRTAVARYAGFRNFRDFKHLELNRFDYTSQDALAFDEAIAREVVPVASRFLRQRREALKLDRLRPWDLAVDLSGRPPLVPFQDVGQLIAGCGEIFQRLDPALGAQFQIMRDRGLLDLANRKGKAAGGYQWGLDEVRLPFIFMNATGLQEDAMTLLHEGGHSFHAFAVRQDPLFMYRETFTSGLPGSIPSEFAEVASQAMELFGQHHLDVFYRDPADVARARRKFFEGIVTFLPWMATVDSFQHWVYTHPRATPRQREEEWSRIVTRFAPEIDWSGLDPELRASFHRQLHLFDYPFYFVEYGIAYVGALQLWQQFENDPTAALANYRQALTLGGSRSLPELFNAAGTRFDLSATMLHDLMAAVEQELERLNEPIQNPKRKYAPPPTPSARNATNHPMKTPFPALCVIGSVLFSITAFAAEPPLTPAPTDPGASAFEQTIDRLFAEQYPQPLETFFCSLGTNPELGFRLAGSTAEHAASERIAAEMRAMGLQNVRLEPVPVDAYEFKHASLTVGDRTMTASTLAGSRPAPPEGITAPLVYAKAGTTADFEALGDVTGKLVLIDKRLSSWWFTVPAAEAASRGAVGIVSTATPDDPKFYSVSPDALGSFDSYDLGLPPWIYVSRIDGDWLKAQLAGAPITATLRLDATITPSEAGGVGYNVVGEIPGSAGDDQLIVLVAHQDAFFRAGLDDTGALVNLLTIAKACVSAEHRPRHTLVFLATTAEEYGRSSAHYDWSIGAWWAATQSHTDWVGRVRGLINLEYMAFTGAKMGIHCDPTLQPEAERLLASRPDLQPHGKLIWPRPSTWTDQWTFSAAGIPTVDVIAMSQTYNLGAYHTDFDTEKIMDWGYLAQFAKLAGTLIRSIDTTPLPGSFAALCDELVTRTSPEWITGIGAAPETVARWQKAVADLRAADAAFAEVRANPMADRRSLAVTALLNHNLTSFASRFEECTVFPHEQVLWDATAVRDALAALRAEPAQPTLALEKLTASSLTTIGLVFSSSVYHRELAKRAPGFPRLQWGEQAQLPPPLDLVPSCRLVQSGNTAGAIVELEARRAELLTELNARLARMATTVEQATGRLRAPLEEQFRP